MKAALNSSEELVGDGGFEEEEKQIQIFWRAGDDNDDDDDDNADNDDNTDADANDGGLNKEIYKRAGNTIVTIMMAMTDSGDNVRT